MNIINCHIHLFTIKHVPSRFIKIPLLQQILTPNITRKPLSWIARRILPFTNRDVLDRYVNFLEITANKTQENTFERIRSYYPKKTRFIVLPMDMAFMRAGKVKESLDTQLTKLAQLYQDYPEIIIPFVAVDPRRKEVLDIVKKYVEEYNFKGIKIYPRLGFYPSDEALKPIYKYAQEKGLPVMSHCSRGGVHTRKVTPEMLNHPIRGKVKKIKAKHFSHYFTEPQNYVPILKEFPKLKICLAHFGGNTEWDDYLEKEWDPYNSEIKNTSWVSEIINLMEKYPNLYTDISYTAFHSERYFPLMSVLLDNQKINDKILFGSDYYMVEREKVSEREMSIKVRYALGEEKFNKIAGENAKKYLGIE